MKNLIKTPFSWIFIFGFVILIIIIIIFFYLPNTYAITIGFILGAIVSAIALFISTILVDYYRRPVLEFGKTMVVKAEIQGKVGGGELYSSNIQVKNNGKTIAKNCKGKLIINGESSQVSWFVPTKGSRATMDINAKDYEYLEVAGTVGATFRIIAPTENGWQHYLKNRPIWHITKHDATTLAKLIVTSSNAEPNEVDITFKSTDTLKAENEKEPVFI